MAEWVDAFRTAFRRGTTAFAALPPMRLSAWADEHFYLSEESSYEKGRWVTLPPQRAIMDCMSHADIALVVIVKGTRTGGSKMLLAFIAYTATRLRRKQVVYRPTDQDAGKFSTVDLITTIRDVPALREALPCWDKRHHPDNKVDQKIFLGAPCYIKGGNAERNFRDLTVDHVLMDEVDAFPGDVEGKGSPVKLAKRRNAGATFPKQVLNSSPTLRYFSLIEEARDGCEAVFTYHVPCPQCGHLHVLEWRDLEKWGDNKRGHGLTWIDGKPETVHYVCPDCGAQYVQADFLAQYRHGRWTDSRGVWIDTTGGRLVFRDMDGRPVRAPHSVAFDRYWTAYSPMEDWANIVREYIEAFAKHQKGDDTALKTWVTNILGMSWESEADKTEASALRKRAEPYKLGIVPRGAVELYAGIDAQKDRFEIVVLAYGPGEESWVVWYEQIEANPDIQADWDRCLDPWFDREFLHACGKPLKLAGVAVDAGNWSMQAYRYVRNRRNRKVIAVKGAKAADADFINRLHRPDKNSRGKAAAMGVKVWYLGVNKGKDLLFGRLNLDRPGAGYMHFSTELPADFYEQLTAEKRVMRHTATGTESRWVKDGATRNEVLDCVNYALAAAYILGNMDKRKPWQWAQLVEALNPQNGDLFAPDVEADGPQENPILTRRTPPTKPARGGFATRW